MSFNSEKELYDYIQHLETLPINQESVFEIHNFLKFSPNKFARKLKIDEEQFQKKFNQLKKPLHLKCLTYKKILKLKDYRPELGIYDKFLRATSWDLKNWEKIQLKKNMCICKKNLKDDLCFYESIFYSYCEFGHIIMVFNENNTILEISPKKFNEYFIDYREWIINNILS